jgi:hypothetical protein
MGGVLVVLFYWYDDGGMGTDEFGSEEFLQQP